jgi:prevent-host-death family protein
MRIAPLATVKAQLSAYLEQCKEEGPIVITRNGKAVAVLLAPIDDDDLEGLLLARSPRFQALLDKSRASIRAGKGLSSQQFWDAVAQRHEDEAKGKRVSRSRRPGRGAAAKGHDKRERG